MRLSHKRKRQSKHGQYTPLIIWQRRRVMQERAARAWELAQCYMRANALAYELKQSLENTDVIKATSKCDTSQQKTHALSWFQRLFLCLKKPLNVILN